MDTSVTNMPTAAVWIIAITQIIFAFSTLLIAVAMISVMNTLKKLLEEATTAVGEARTSLPQLVKSIGDRS